MPCPVCERELREDDPGFQAELPGYGMVAACRACAGRGEDPVYSIGGLPGVRKIPRIGDRLIFVCGWCRHAMRCGDEGTRVRLYPEEVTPGVQYGVLVVCRECLPLLLPTVRCRLGLPAEAGVFGNSLL